MTKDQCLHGIKGELESVSDSGFFIDVVQVFFYGLVGYAQAFRNLLVPISLTDQGNYFRLPFG